MGHGAWSESLFHAPCSMLHEAWNSSSNTTSLCILCTGSPSFMKKEVLKLEKEKFKLERNLGGIKDMPGVPDAMFIADSHKETIALKEANRLGIPVVAITDTNADPDDIDYIIPGNDDSLKSLKVFVSTVAEACLSGKRSAKDRRKVDSKADAVKAGSFHDDQGHTVSVEKIKKVNEKKNSEDKDKQPKEEK